MASEYQGIHILQSCFSIADSTIGKEMKLKKLHHHSSFEVCDFPESTEIHKFPESISYVQVEVADQLRQRCGPLSFTGMLSGGFWEFWLMTAPSLGKQRPFQDSID